MGIRFTPGTSAKLVINDSIVSDNGIGIYIGPAPTGFAFAVIRRVILEGNVAEGVKATGVGGGGVQVSVRDSVASLNGAHGFSAVTTADGSGVLMKIDGSESSFNGGDGVRANMTGVTIGNSMVMGNNGIGLAAYNGGAVNSFGNNGVFDNTVDGAPSSVIPMK